MKIVSVLIQHHAGPTGDVLICKNKDGVWEFPSALVHTNEAEEAAAARVAVEQLGMTVKVGKMAMIGHKMPSDGYVEHLVCGNITHNTNTKDFWHCYYEAVDTWQTEPCTAIYDEFAWVHPSELCNYEFAGDDKNFMAKYGPYVNAQVIPDVRMY